MTLPPPLARLARDTRGVALLEFAFTAPLLLAMGMYGAECANLALVNLRVSQIALNLADNAARVGDDANLSTQQLREIDVNDVLQAARYQGKSIDLTTNGRVILSSLENIKQSYDSTAVQRVHWQRCIGAKNGTDFDSHYGTTTTAAGTDATAGNAGTTSTGMGEAGSKVSPPAGSGVMFVEINYQYKPLITGYLLPSTSKIRYVASFIVRDNRDFSRLFNPAPAATRSTCNLYAA